MGGQSSAGEVKLKHFFFSEVIKRQAYGKQLIIVRKPIKSQSEYNNWKQIYNQAIGMHKDSLFLPQNSDKRPLKRSILQCNCCGAQLETQLTYENFDYFLHSQLVNRMKGKTYFEQKELLFMLYKLLEGSKEFQNKRLSLGDIRPKNIICGKSQDLKMINLASFPWEKTSIDKLLDDNNINTIFYFAPQQLAFLASNQQRGKYPNATTQAFSIGLTLLDIALLKNSQELYIKKRESFNTVEHQARMKEVNAKYPILYRYLKVISQIDPSKRLSSGEAWSCMQQYSVWITELKPFKINQAQQKQSLNKYRKQQGR